MRQYLKQKIKNRIGDNKVYYSNDNLIVKEQLLFTLFDKFCRYY